MAVLGTDDFNRADTANGLGSNWATRWGQNGTDVFRIESNQVGIAAAGGSSGQYNVGYSAVTWPNDQWSQCTVTDLGTAGDIGPTVRILGSSGVTFFPRTAGNGGYLVEWAGTSSPFTESIAGSSTGGVVNDVAYLEVQGTTYIARINGVQVLSATNSRNASGTAGLGVFWTGSDPYNVDNWSGGDFVADLLESDCSQSEQTAGQAYQRHWLAVAASDAASGYPLGNRLPEAPMAGVSLDDPAVWQPRLLAFQHAALEFGAWSSDAGDISLPTGLASEVDTAFGRGTTLAAGLATEVDTAFARGLTQAPGLAIETDTALALSVRVGVGLANETDTAFGLALLSGTNLPTGLAIETDTALGLAMRVGTGLAVETDTAIARALRVGTGLASEADTALGRGLTVGAGLAAETDTATARGAAVGVGLAIEADTAFALGPSGGAVSLPVGLAIETDAAFALDVGSPAEISSFVGVPGRIVAPRYLVKVGDKRWVVETEEEFRRLVAKFESNDLPKLKKQVKRIPAPVVIEAESVMVEAAQPINTELAGRLFARIQRWNKTLERLRAEAMLRKMAQDEDEDEESLLMLL